MCTLTSIYHILIVVSHHITHILLWLEDDIRVIQEYISGLFRDQSARFRSRHVIFFIIQTYNTTNEEHCTVYCRMYAIL